ncbi:MAG: hypothetical protein V4563_14050 [Pseudomonadota bacterium]
MRRFNSAVENLDRMTSFRFDRLGPDKLFNLAKALYSRNLAADFYVAWLDVLVAKTDAVIAKHDSIIQGMEAPLV